MHAQLELDLAYGTTTPEGQTQDAFLTELAAVDLTNTLRKAALGDSLSDIERQQLHLLATDLGSGTKEIVDTGTAFAPPF